MKISSKHYPASFCFSVKFEFLCFHLPFKFLICDGLGSYYLNEISCWGRFVRIINFALRKKVSYQVLHNKSHHTQAKYTMEFSMKEEFY